MAHYKGVANDEAFDDAAHMARCALNPQTMQGHKYDLKPAKKQKTVAVIGGGIGGMETARIAALRGHKVTIYEKSDKLGGVFVAAAAPDFKEKDKALIKWYIKQIGDLKIPVKFNCEIKDAESLKEDEIVVATGAVARKINIKGIERAIEAVDYLLGADTGENVTVIGGGLTGCEIAYDLYLKGKKPTIVEMKNDLIAVRGVCLANSSYLRDFFAYKKIPVFLESKVTEITENGVTIAGANGKKTNVGADSVIISVGYTPAPVAAKSKRVSVVGDANGVGNLRTVIWRAWDVAMKL